MRRSALSARVSCGAQAALARTVPRAPGLSRLSAQLLVVGTYRPVEAIVHQPLRTVVQDTVRHGSATALPLALLSPDAVAAYLAVRFPGHQFPATLAAWLQQRTDGNPLFLVTLVQALVEQGVLQEYAGYWTVQGMIEALALDVPETLGQLLEQQLTCLPRCVRLWPRVSRWGST